MKTYYLGNCLRGYFKGDFVDIDVAWRWLSTRFLLSFPIDEGSSGRTVQMYVKQTNEFGFDDIVMCKVGLTDINNLPREEVIEHCNHTAFFR